MLDIQKYLDYAKLIGHKVEIFDNFHYIHDKCSDDVTFIRINVKDEDLTVVFEGNYYLFESRIEQEYLDGIFELFFDEQYYSLSRMYR